MLFPFAVPWQARLAVAVLVVSLNAGASWAGDKNAPSIYCGVGWDGHVVLGSWSMLMTECDLAEPGNYRLEVTATDPDGNLATYLGSETACDAGRRRLAGRFQLGRPDGVVTARIVRDGKPWRDIVVPKLGDPLAPLIPHTQAERILITLGLPEVVQQMLPRPSPGRRTIVHYPDASALPTDDMAYDSVVGVLIAGRTLPDESQSAALMRWVRRGGRLSISFASTPAEFGASALAPLLPVTVEPEPVPTRELTSLESYAGKSVRVIPPGTRVLLPKFTYRFGKSLAGNRQDSVLIEVPQGFGAVTLLGMDVTQSPLKDWPGLRDLLRKMTATAESAAGSGRKQQLGSTGITELASQLAAAMEHFEPVARTSPWWVLGGLIGVLALIGPLDYWIVSRITRKPLTTWITFPLFLLASASAALWAAGSANGDRWLLNQLDVIDLDAATGTARGRHWLTAYSPQSAAGQIEVQPHWAGWSATESENSGVRLALGWTGLPETSFGGMYRTGSGGLQLGQARYAIDPFAGTVKDIPWAQWSTAAWSAQSEAALPDVVESQLSSSAAGRLSGTVTHRLPGPLTDWFLVYADRIFRLPAKDGGDAVAPLEPKQPFRVDQRAVLQRELRGYLTRTTAREIQRTKEKTSTQIVVQQANYDALARDLKSILPILSFHQDVGGTAYTGLTNETLADQDLSPLLDLDRAVLYGYLEQSAVSVKLSAPADPTRQQTTVIRLVLPVDRSKQAVREMPIYDFDKDKK